MVDIANNNFRVTLDWSEGNVKQIEDIATTLHNDYVKKKPTDETFSTFVTNGVESLWTDSALLGDRRDPVGHFGPGAKRNNALLGPKDNIWHYHHVLSKPKTDGYQARGVGLATPALRVAHARR